MIDVIYPLGTGSIWDNNELRYSLRSVEKHLKGYRNIYIVGECPEWLQNVIHIPCCDMHYADRNIMEKVKAAFRDSRITNKAFFSNDDHFLLKDVNAETYPYYYKADLPETLIKNPTNYYHQTYIAGVLSELRKRKLPLLNFDTHTPIVFEKDKFLEVMDQYDWNNNYTLKSIYCNTLSIPGVYMKDYKINGRIAEWRLRQELNKADVWSITDRSLQAYAGDQESAVKTLLNELYPNKSKYER